MRSTIDSYLRFSFTSSYGSSKRGSVTCTCDLDLYMKCRSPGMPRSATEYSVSPRSTASERACSKPSCVNRWMAAGSQPSADESTCEDDTHPRDRVAPTPHSLKIRTAADTDQADFRRGFLLLGQTRALAEVHSFRRLATLRWRFAALASRRKCLEERRCDRYLLRFSSKEHHVGIDKCGRIELWEADW